VLLSNGASPNVLRPTGERFHCSQYQGVQHLMDAHLSAHSQRVFEAIADRKGLARLRNTFLVCSSSSSSSSFSSSSSSSIRCHRCRRCHCLLFAVVCCLSLLLLSSYSVYCFSLGVSVLFLQAKHDHNLRDSASGDTPLMFACLHGKVEAVKFLLQSATYCLNCDARTQSVVLVSCQSLLCHYPDIYWSEVSLHCVPCGSREL